MLSQPGPACSRERRQLHMATNTDRQSGLLQRPLLHLIEILPKERQHTDQLDLSQEEAPDQTRAARHDQNQCGLSIGAGWLSKPTKESGLSRQRLWCYLFYQLASLGSWSTALRSLAGHSHTWSDWSQESNLVVRYQPCSKDHENQPKSELRWSTFHILSPEHHNQGWKPTKFPQACQDDVFGEVVLP